MLEINSLELYHSENILDFNKAISLIRDIKSQGKTVGLCHGGFDLVHPGHVKHFEMAKKQCDVLFVSITADQFVTSRKGSGRPVYTDKLRAYTVASIGFVDYVVISNFKKGIEIINTLKPSFYIKGPDYINKTTPGIISEREAIKNVGGNIKYTTEPPMSTTKLIEYIKKEIENRELLILIDRDGTLIENDDFLGKDDNWKEELKFKEEVISFISHLQTKFKTTKIVVSNQAGVARKLFNCSRVEEINNYINSELSSRGINITDWKYCPDVDSSYAKLKKDEDFNEIDFDYNFVKETTKRKPDTGMVIDALEKLGKEVGDFGEVLVLGDREDDKGLAKNLNAKFIDVKEKSYEELIKEMQVF